MTAGQAPAQHTSHRGLLAEAGKPRCDPAVTFDAIIVPNGRPAADLEHVFTAARHARTRLVLFCSVQAEAGPAFEAAERAGVEVLAFDTDRLPRSLVPAFQADDLLRRDFVFHRRTDTSFKRNLGLLLANLTGWQRVLFLDDDIELPRPDDLFEAAGLLGEYDAVGLANVGMRDNSVVCHALHDTDGKQDTFIGGGALAVGQAGFRSFFPNIYNEDWFFLLDGSTLRPSILTGAAYQSPYNPYAKPDRAEGEELGDTLAEGVFGLLDTDSSIEDATSPYWERFLVSRRQFIGNVLARVHASSIAAPRREQMIAALEAAMSRSKMISADFCVEYLRRWQGDRVRWQEHLDVLRDEHGTDLEVDVAMKVLGIEPYTPGRFSSGARPAWGVPAATAV